MSSDYDHPITLPLSLEEVAFGLYFNQKLTLPPPLKVLDLSESLFNHPIILPDSLHTAKLGDELQEEVTFGAGLRKLVWLCNKSLCVPNTLKELSLGFKFKQHLDLPAGLESVQFCGKYDLPLLLPSSLRRIEFKKPYDLPLVLPSGCIRHNVPPIVYY